MNTLSLALRVLAIVAALIATGLFFVGKDKPAEKQAEPEQFQSTLAAVRDELSEANEKITRLNGQIGTERSAHADTRRDLESVRSELRIAQQEVRRTQEQLAQARTSLEDLEGTTRRLRADLLSTEQERDRSLQTRDSQIAELRDVVANLEADKTRLNSSLDSALQRIDFIAGGPLGGTLNMPIGPEATIRSVSPENGLLTFANTGQLGITAGNEVTLVRDARSLGKVAISRVTDDAILVHILPGARLNSLTPGSTVRLLR